MMLLLMCSFGRLGEADVIVDLFAWSPNLFMPRFPTFRGRCDFTKGHHVDKIPILSLICSPVWVRHTFVIILARRCVRSAASI